MWDSSVGPRLCRDTEDPPVLCLDKLFYFTLTTHTEDVKLEVVHV